MKHPVLVIIIKNKEADGLGGLGGAAGGESGSRITAALLPTSRFLLYINITKS